MVRLRSRAVARMQLGIGLAILSCAALASDTRQLAVFGVPLGATVADVQQMARSRGISGPIDERCNNLANLCGWRVNIENLPGTEFHSTISGQIRQGEREEAFAYAFMAPPNDHRIWSAGSESRYGKWFAPGSNAPLFTDVVAELTRRFGEPAAVFSSGGGPVSRALPPGDLYWAWDAAGVPVRWTQLQRQTCYHAVGKSAVIPKAASNRNPVATDPEPFLLARRGNCAVMVRAQIGHEKGLVHYLQVHVLDFKTGHDALFRTTQLVRQQRAKANSERSITNRPDF